ncbi:MAG: carboxymuconolactone decarboxylase family protein [Ignavibacteriales bacterium]|nr:carboxymuconolactone decarboxylase family protein [Ignavibacteriales bacterium]
MKNPASYRLTVREEQCMLIATLLAIGKRQKAFSAMKRAIENDQLPRKFFAELLLHLSLFLGFPIMLDGLEKLYVIRPTKQRLNLKQPSRNTLRRKGISILTRIYGEQAQRVLKNLNVLHPELSERIVEDAYGRILSRKGLTLQERELINVTVLSIQGYHRQLFSHLRGAMRVGVPHKKIRTTLQKVRTISNINVNEALKMLDEISATRL